MKYEYWQTEKQEWYWRLKAANGEKVAQSEGYKNKNDCLAAIKLVKSSAKAPELEV